MSPTRLPEPDQEVLAGSSAIIKDLEQIVAPDAVISDEESRSTPNSGYVSNLDDLLLEPPLIAWNRLARIAFAHTHGQRRLGLGPHERLPRLGCRFAKRRTGKLLRGDSLPAG